MRRLRICAALIFCSGCGGPLVVPVDVTLGDANVAHPQSDDAAETPVELADGGAYDAGWPAADAGTPDAAHADAAHDARVGSGMRCVVLPDPVLSVALGDSALAGPPSDIVQVNDDDALGCGLPVDAGPSLEENPNLDAGTGSATLMHANYERLDGDAILVGGRHYALSVPADANLLNPKVLLASVYSGEVACEEREQFGSIVSLPLGANCVDLAPQRDAHYLRLPIEMSGLVSSTSLTLCQATCSDLGP